MKTFSNEIETIERYLSDCMTHNEREDFEASLERDAGLRLSVFLQRKLHQLVALYHRRKMRRHIADFHTTFFCHPGKRDYREKVLSLFNSER